MVLVLLHNNIAFAAPQKITFKTNDNQTLHALFVLPKNGTMVIMLHGLASAKEEWTPLIEKLTAKGFGVLAYDARGHGTSSTTKDADGNPNGFQYFSRPGPGSPWEQMINDVGAAIKYIRTNVPSTKEVPIYLCGASLGANVALNYASLTRHSVKGLILLSPGQSYVEIKTDLGTDLEPIWNRFYWTNERWTFVVCVVYSSVEVNTGCVGTPDGSSGTEDL
jgi:alpha-beta hydrolase superfamily lysophospholipase